MVVLFWFIVIKVMSSNEECYIQTTFQLKSCTVKELPSNEAATKATPFIIEHSSGKHSDYSHVQEQGMRVLSQIRTAQSIHVDIKEQKKKKKKSDKITPGFHSYSMSNLSMPTRRLTETSHHG